MRFISLLAAAAAGALVLFGSGAASAADNSRVRVVHASPDAPNVDVFANGNRVLSNVPFNTVSDYLSVPAGTYRFQVAPAGKTTADSVIDINATLAANKDYTVVALDRVSQIKSRVFEDNNAAPAPGKAHVQVVHASPDAPSVDIALRGGAVLVPNLGFGSKAGPLPVDAGTYNLEVRAAGTSTVALPVNNLTLQAGKVYTVFATGLLSGTPPLGVLPAAVEGVSAAPAAPSGGLPQIHSPRTGDAGLVGGDSGSVLLPLAALAVIVLGTTAAIRVRAKA